MASAASRATTSRPASLLAQAARQNYDTAQIDLAAWMIEGRGGARDLKSGFGWMKQAAEGGNVAAQNRLAKLYMDGIGTDPDLILAGAWYIVARRAGLIDPEMDDFLQGLSDDQTKQALAEVEPPAVIGKHRGTWCHVDRSCLTFSCDGTQRGSIPRLD